MSTILPMAARGQNGVRGHIPTMKRIEDAGDDDA